MALDAAFTRDDGRANVPGVDSPWHDWVAASKTYHYCSDDPLLDWLEAFGATQGFTPDAVPDGAGLNTDFRAVIFEKANCFETAVVAYLGRHYQLTTICQGSGDTRERAKVDATWRAMRDGVEIIAQGVLWNAETQTYGAPDLLIRSDVLRKIFPDNLSEAEARQGAPDLSSADRHYRVVDVKFTTLDLLRDGHAASSHLKYIVQVWLYNQALGRLQGITPSAGYLLGRRWKQGDDRGASALERLARIDRDSWSIAELALAACDWRRRLHADGTTWRALPEPSVPELRPNMRHAEDQPWHGAKGQIARALEDLTMLPRVTPEKRSAAESRGICRWTDSRCCAAALGITGPSLEPLVDAVIAANHSDPDGPLVFPDRVTVNEALWRECSPAEFYVDFETVSDLDEDFRAFPLAGGQPLIFMIGCGWWSAAVDRPVWNHRVFTTPRLTLANERQIIEDWLATMAAVCLERGTTLAEARVFHWSPAETSTLVSAYNSAFERQGQPDWPTIPWIDLLGRVVRQQPVTVRGAFGFGLKAIARAMHEHGLIQTSWSDSATDGLGAMVGAWSCDHEAARLGCTMSALALMREIEAYNEVDCKVMAEVLSYLRRHR